MRYVTDSICTVLLDRGHRYVTKPLDQTAAQAWLRAKPWRCVLWDEDAVQFVSSAIHQLLSFRRRDFFESIAVEQYAIGDEILIVAHDDDFNPIFTLATITAKC